MEDYPKMISGENIMKLCHVDALRIFDLFTSGLQPYKQTGREFRPPAEFHRYNLMLKKHEALLKHWNEMRKDLETLKNQLLSEHYKIQKKDGETDIEFLKRNAETPQDRLLVGHFENQEENGEILNKEIISIWKEACRIKREDPELRLWKYFEKDNVDDDKLQELIDHIKECQFEADQVKKYFSITEQDAASQNTVVTGIELPEVPTPQHNMNALSPSFSFYKDGNIWTIGLFGKEQHFTQKIGYSFIHFLLQHRNQQIAPRIVRNLGQVAGHNEGVIVSPKPEMLMDKKAISDAKEALKKLLDRRDSSYDPDEQERLSEQIDKYETYLKDRNRKGYTNEDESARKNVQKKIKECIDEIIRHFEKSAPSLIQELKYITTGYTCQYNGQAEWKLNGQP